MAIYYWLDLYTGTACEKFRSDGSCFSAFHAAARRAAGGVLPGDILLCYMTGVMRWVGALEVVRRVEATEVNPSGSHKPIRFEVRPLVVLTPEYGVPMTDLQGRVAFFGTTKDRGTFKGFVRRTPNRFRRT